MKNFDVHTARTYLTFSDTNFVERMLEICSVCPAVITQSLLHKDQNRN